MSKNGYRHLHVIISDEDYDNFIKCLPDKGLISSVVRRLIRSYTMFANSKCNVKESIIKSSISNQEDT